MTALVPISEQEFGQIQRFIFNAAGISLSPEKKALVAGRLSRRVRHCGLSSFAEYHRLISGGQASGETQIAIDLLTTNETYFFREPKHFELLHKLASQARGRGESFRVWSAASSSGEEAYSIAMVLADELGMSGWEVVASDISTRVLERARSAHYSMERAQGIPLAYLKRFCLKGTGSQAGTLLIQRELRQKVQFIQLNLNQELPRLAPFDVVFLRNVMIYFNGNTKREVVDRVAGLIRPGGHLFVGHSESLHGISNSVEQVQTAVYRKP